MCPARRRAPSEAGFKVGGWFELGLAPIEGIRFDARVIVMATQDGFARRRPRRGAARRRATRSHVAVGVEYLADGRRERLLPARLGHGAAGCRWRRRSRSRTCRRRIAIPACGSTTTSARDVGGGVRLGIRVGYAARNQSVAGFTGGAGAAVEF